MLDLLPQVIFLLNQFQHPPLHGTDQVPLPAQLLLVHGIPPFGLLLLLLQLCLQPGPLFLTPAQLLLQGLQLLFLLLQQLLLVPDLLLGFLEPMSEALDHILQGHLCLFLHPGHISHSCLLLRLLCGGAFLCSQALKEPGLPRDAEHLPLLPTP